MTTLGPLLVVVPALNEGASIGKVVKEVSITGLDVLVVDDGSTDETSVRAETAGAKVLRLPMNLGVGGALQVGFRYAVDHGYEAVIQVDGDGQHPVQDIGRLIKAATETGSHLVIGSRYLSSVATLKPTAPRRLAMRILSVVISRVAGTPITDSTSGFRIIRQPLLSRFAEDFPTYYLGDTFEATVRAARFGFRIAEVPAALRERKFGRSSTKSTRAIFLVGKVVLATLLLIGFHN